MSLLIIVTITIAFVCNLIAGVGSYLILFTDHLQRYRIQERRYKPDLFWKRLPLIAFNLSTLFILTIIGLYLSFPLFELHTSSFTVIALQFVLLVIVDDAYFYFFHRTLHTTPYLYRRIHKIHHRAFAPFPLEYIYVHPLEWMIGAIGIPIGLTIIYLMHGSISAYAFWAFSFWRNIHEVDIHSGLRSKIGKYFSLYGTVEHHDKHHMKNTKGNYASTFTFWDRLLGTYIETKK